MENQNGWLFELKQGIIGTWNNNDYTFTFNGIRIDNSNDGAATLHNKHIASETSGVYNVFIHENMPLLRILIKHGEIIKPLEFNFALLEDNKLRLTNSRGFLAMLDKVA